MCVHLGKPKSQNEVSVASFAFLLSPFMYFNKHGMMVVYTEPDERERERDRERNVQKFMFGLILCLCCAVTLALGRSWWRLSRIRSLHRARPFTPL